MYKIEIDWDFRSPSLGVLTGQVKLGHIDFGLLDPKKFPPFPIKKEKSSRGYSNCPALFNRCKPLVDIMVDAYYDGMLMRELSYSWFRDCSRYNNDVTIIIPD